MFEKPKQSVLAVYSTTREKAALSQPMTSVRNIFPIDLDVTRPKGVLGFFRRSDAQDAERERFTRERMQAAVDEALAVEINRLKLLGNYQRLRDHTFISEELSRLSPEVAASFARAQSDIQKKLNDQAFSDAKTIHAQRKELGDARKSDAIGERAFMKRMEALDAIEDRMRENLEGLLWQLSEKAAEDIARALNMLKTAE